MNPLVLYLALVTGAVLIALVAMAVSRPATRPCPSCAEGVSLSARACGSCGYAFR